MARSENTNGKFREKLEQPSSQILIYILGLSPIDGNYYFNRINRALRFIKNYGQNNTALNNVHHIIPTMVSSVSGKSERKIALELGVERNHVKQTMRAFERAVGLAFDQQFLSQFNFENRFENSDEERLARIMIAYDKLPENITRLMKSPKFRKLWDRNQHYATLIRLLCDGYGINEIYDKFGVPPMEPKPENQVMNKFAQFVLRDPDLNYLPGYTPSKLILFGNAIADGTSWEHENLRLSINESAMGIIDMTLVKHENHTYFWILNVFLHLMPLLHNALPQIFKQELGEYVTLDSGPESTVLTLKEYLFHYRMETTSRIPLALRYIMILIIKGVEVKTIGSLLSVYISENKINLSEYGFDNTAPVRPGPQFMEGETLATITLIHAISAGVTWLQNILLQDSTNRIKPGIEETFSVSHDEDINYLASHIFNYGKES